MAAEFEKGLRIQNLERALLNPDAALKQVGTIMVAESQESFREQKFGDKAWKDRGPINVFGIVADFAAGKSSPPSRRFDRRPVLRDTGRMAASIAYRIVNSDTVEVGTNVGYGKVLHTGGEIESKTIDETVQQALAKWLKGKGKPYRSKLGWLLNKKYRGQKLHGTVPPRPFVGITKQTVDDIHEAVRVRVMEAR